jgi:hypothetical protein
MQVPRLCLTVIGTTKLNKLTSQDGGLFFAGPARGRFRRRLRTSKPVSANNTPVKAAPED